MSSQFPREQQAPSFWASLDIQRRVIGALIMREVLTRYGRHDIGFFWLFVEPMIFTLGILALWTFARVPHGANLSLVSFAVTGYSSVLLWRNMPARAIGAVEPNLSLMYHRQVKILDIFFARLILEALGATMSFAILGTLFTAAGWMQPPDDIPKVIAGWLMLAWFGSSLAIFLGALSTRTEVLEKLWPPFTYITFPLSGAGFMVEWLPVEAQKFVLALPMVHGIELLREGYFGNAVKATYDIGYMATVSLVLTLLGLALTRSASRQVTPE
jgi:ABC-type polysaccharide/polyol phosphate export permease